MVETISPVVHGGRNRNYWTTIALHTLGATASAGLLGALLGAAGWVLGAPWGSAGYVLIALTALIYFAREAFGAPIPLPQLRRQVPEWWRAFYSRNVAALLYGLGLGIAFMTYLSFGTFVVVAVGALATGHPGLGALIVGAFGLSRGFSIAAQVPVGRLDHLAQSHRPRVINATTVGAVALTAMSSVVLR